MHEKSWLRRRVEKAFTKALTRAYETVKVDPQRFLLELRAAHGLPITSFQGMYTVEPPVLDTVAEQIIRSSMKIAAAEGAGFGLGGFITIVPDFSILAAITLRTIQKLSLVYGFEFNTDEEMAELWIAAASAAGVDLGRDLLEKNVVNRLIPRIIQRIAAKASTEFVEKWAGRLIPVANYRRRAELLFRSRMGRAGAGALPAKALGVAQAYAAAADNRSCFDNILKATLKTRRYTKVWRSCRYKVPSCSFVSFVVSGFGMLQLI